MFCQKYPPTTELRPFIEKYILLEEINDLQKPTSIIVPPSINKGLFFFIHCQGDIFIKNNNLSPIPINYLLAHGTKSYHWVHQKKFCLFGVIFKPGQFRRFFPFSARQFVDRIVPLEKLECFSILNCAQRVRNTRSIEQMIEITDKYFIKNLKNTDSDLIDKAIQLMFSNPEKKLRYIYSNLPVVERHFLRLFKQEIGISPKQYQKQIRFHKALQFIHNEDYKRLKDIAYCCGYYDQTQFINQFKLYTNCTPKKYVSQLLNQADLNPPNGNITGLKALWT